MSLVVSAFVKDRFLKFLWGHASAMMYPLLKRPGLVTMQVPAEWFSFYFTRFCFFLSARSWFHSCFTASNLSFFLFYFFFFFTALWLYSLSWYFLCAFFSFLFLLVFIFSLLLKSIPRLMEELFLLPLIFVVVVFALRFAAWSNAISQEKESATAGILNELAQWN